MKKQLAILLAFMMIMSTMCGFASAVNVGGTPSANAPIYTVFAGATTLGSGNKANGDTLFTGAWSEFESGKFPLMVQITNTEAALSGTFVIKYDATKVKPLTYKNGSWVDATAADGVWYESEFSGEIGVGSTTSGMYVDGDNAYVYANWMAAQGAFNAEELIADGNNPELGAFVFETLEGKTIDDFDKNTFTIVTETLAANSPIKTGLASNGSPLTCNVQISGATAAFGISDIADRLPMTVNFSYPNSTSEPGSNGGDTSDPEISANAPIYTVFAGATTLGSGNKANGDTLFTGAWSEFESGKFPLMVQITNTEAALSGTFVIKYDATKVKPLTYKNGSWVDATAADGVWYESEFSGEIGVGSTTSGMYVDGDNAYVYANWMAAQGAFNAEELIADGNNPELGAFVFETLEGKTIDDFDKNTFTIVTETLAENNPIKTGLASNGSPLTCNVQIEGTVTAFGISDTADRLPMTVNFSYPNSTRVPSGGGVTPNPETFTVTFMVDGETVHTITKNVGQTVTVSEFPTVEDRTGYTFAWDVTTDITTTTTVTGVYEIIVTEGLTLADVQTTGFSIGTFNAATLNYNAVVTDSFEGNYYVINGVAADGVDVTYFVDGVEAEYTVGGALYFDMMAGTTSSIMIKLDDGEGETYYTVNVTNLPATNEFFLTSGFDFDFDEAVDTYTVDSIADGEAYLRLWSPERVGMTIEYAIGGAGDTAENAIYATQAVGCDSRENTLFANTPNFDTEWAHKSFVNLWTEDIASLNKMFIKITEGDDVNYYTINFN